MSSPYKTAALCTLGCKVNFTETSMISRKFEELGVSLVPFDEFSDIYVINTCSVTENADTKCDKLVKKLRRKNPDAYIIVTGCYAQLKSDRLSDNKDIDLVVGTDDIAESFLRQQKKPGEQYRVLGLIGTDEGAVGRYIHGIPILGDTEHLKSVLNSFKNTPNKITFI